MNRFHVGLLSGITGAAAVLIPLLSATVPGQTGWELAETKKRAADLETRLRDETAAKDTAVLATQELETKLAETQAKLEAALSDNVFATDSAYPKSFGSVRLGDRADALLSAYPGMVVEQDDEHGYWMLKISHPLFESIVFGFTRGDKRRKIEYVVLNPNFGGVIKDNNKVHRELLQTLGQPAESPEADFFRWELPNGVSVFRTRYTVTMLTGERVPAVWPNRK